MVLEGPERIQVLVLLVIMQEKRWSIPNLGKILFSGFKEDFQMDVFKVLAAILHLGNVQITAVGHERSVISVRYVSVSPILLGGSSAEALGVTLLLHFSTRHTGPTRGISLTRTRKIGVSMGYLQRVKLSFPCNSREGGNTSSVCFPFIQQIFIECLLCARHCCRLWRNISEQNKIRRPSWSFWSGGENGGEETQ